MGGAQATVPGRWQAGAAVLWEGRGRQCRGAGRRARQGLDWTGSYASAHVGSEAGCPREAWRLRVAVPTRARWLPAAGCSPRRSWNPMPWITSCAIFSSLGPRVGRGKSSRVSSCKRGTGAGVGAAGCSAGTGTSWSHLPPSAPWPHPHRHGLAGGHCHPGGCQYLLLVRRGEGVEPLVLPCQRAGPRPGRGRLDGLANPRAPVSGLLHAHSHWLRSGRRGGGWGRGT